MEHIDTWVAALPAGRAGLVVSEEGAGALAQVGAALRPRTTVITHRLTPAARLDEAIEAIVRALADAAALLWPAWYGETRDGPRDRPAAVLERWTSAASALIAENRPPLVFGLPLGVQARQLAYAVDPENLAVAIAFDGDVAASAALLALGRAAEWVAEKASARVIAIVSAEQARDPALDCISYRLFRLDGEQTTTPAQARTSVYPMAGRPHPLSSAERALARALSRDPELSSFFALNQPVITGQDRRLVVDLLWVDGRLVVELDGWEVHKSRMSFVSDRNRDYELALAGYQVLRLTNEEVLEDPDREVAKIRALVRKRQAALRARGA